MRHRLCYCRYRTAFSVIWRNSNSTCGTGMFSWYFDVMSYCMCWLQKSFGTERTRKYIFFSPLLVVLQFSAQNKSEKLPKPDNVK